MPRVEVATVEFNGPDTRWHCAVRESVAVVCHMLWTYTEAGLLLCALEISHGFLERRWHIPSADGEVEVEGIPMAGQVMNKKHGGLKALRKAGACRRDAGDVTGERSGARPQWLGITPRSLCFIFLAAGKGNDGKQVCNLEECSPAAGRG